MDTSSVRHANTQTAAAGEMKQDSRFSTPNEARQKESVSQGRPLREASLEVGQEVTDGPRGAVLLIGRDRDFGVAWTMKHRRQV